LRVASDFAIFLENNMSDSAIRTVASAVAVAASATFGGGVFATVAQAPNPADAITKQAQATSLMLSMGDLVVAASSPECNMKKQRA
jgi:hypothetical protein